ncbi:MAG TPA: twin-arginine translocase TatA/TatE family subunit [Pyrinomonadaceae bacterium]|nr:twin-arginine translocase TatA/TatE family subunit [Pyrinomonadaceae bacterium]
MLGLGTPEIIGIVVILFLLFGATRLPQLAKSLGQSRKAFKEGMREAEEEERAEQLPASNPTPQVNAMSDEGLSDETRRRAEAKQS